MSTNQKLRCRYQVWGGPREMFSYQCWNAAKTTRSLAVRGTKEVPAHREDLPVCGTHARAVDRDPTGFDRAAYVWNGSKYESPVQEHVR